MTLEKDLYLEMEEEGVFPTFLFDLPLSILVLQTLIKSMNYGLLIPTTSTLIIALMRVPVVPNYR